MFGPEKLHRVYTVEVYCHRVVWGFKKLENFNEGRKYFREIKCICG